MDALPPKVFQASMQARGGDVIGIQGTGLDATATVRLDNGRGGTAALPIVNRVAASWLAVQLPTPLPEPLLIRVANRHGDGPLLRINAARPQMLDATRIVPGGRFRILGRDLTAPAHRPVVLVGGRAATVDEAASTATMLVVAAPPGLPPGPAAVTCDNGNGTGAGALEGGVRVVEGDGADPLGLGVGWAGGFTYADRVQPSDAVCDGVADDTRRIADAVSRAAKGGGAVVALPAGTCRITGTVNLASRVVLRGAGGDRTILRYEGNYPVYAENMDLVGLENLQLLNAGQVQEGLVWKNNTRSFIRGVTLTMRTSRQWFLTGNADFVFDRNTVTQTGSYDRQNPYRFDQSSGLVFSNSRSTNANGSPTFQRVHDALFLNNRFTRDAGTQFEDPIVAHHAFVLDFAYRVAIIGNTFDVVNGPVTNTNRNDGETLLVEGGGPFRTEGSGTVDGATADTLDASAGKVNADPFGTGLPRNLGVAVVSGTGAGQVRRIVAAAGGTLTVDHPWDVVPEDGSHYATFVWGLETAIIEGNRLVGNPRGIWLYQSAVRDVAIERNEIEDGGGIYLRSYQNLATGTFTVQTGVTVADNSIRNRTGRWLSQITLAGVTADPSTFGTGQFGIEVRRNLVVANRPNVSSATEDYASREGYADLVHVEAADARPNGMPFILGTIFQNNRCENCDAPYVIGTGSVGTVLVGNEPGPGSPNALTDLPVMGKTSGGAERTLVR